MGLHEDTAVHDDVCTHVFFACRDDLGRLTYTTMCLKEAMRLHPPVPIIQRETNQEFQLEGVTLPPDTFIDIFIYLLHHNEAVWGADHWVRNVLETFFGTCNKLTC